MGKDGGRVAIPLVGPRFPNLYVPPTPPTPPPPLSETNDPGPGVHVHADLPRHVPPHEEEHHSQRPGSQEHLVSHPVWGCLTVVRASGLQQRPCLKENSNGSSVYNSSCDTLEICTRTLSPSTPWAIRLSCTATFGSPASVVTLQSTSYWGTSYPVPYPDCFGSYQLD